MIIFLDYFHFSCIALFYSDLCFVCLLFAFRFQLYYLMGLLSSRLVNFFEILSSFRFIQVLIKFQVFEIVRSLYKMMGIDVYATGNMYT